MDKNSIYILIITSLAILLPVPGRFAYGIVLIVFLNAMMFLATFIRSGVKSIFSSELRPVVMAIALMGLGILSKQLLIMFSPIMALTIGYSLYIPAVSSLFIVNFVKTEDKGLKANLNYNMKKSFILSVVFFFVFLFRDIFGYGTITFPVRYSILEKQLITVKEGGVYPGVFFASIQGLLLLFAIALFVIAYTTTSKIDTIKAFLHLEKTEKNDAK